MKSQFMQQSSNRVLWLTDTFDDHNGVSMVLQAMHREIKFRDLPIDIMVCSNTLKSDDNLIVIRPVASFSLPLYRQQPFRIPGYLKINKIFKQNKYNKVICSTEGPMGLAALYLKKRHSVMTYFYLHTDWIMFARKVMGFEDPGLKRLQVIMRAYYKMFDYIFVLNTDQKQWLTGNSMRFENDRVLMTAHWADKIFTERQSIKRCLGPEFQRDPVLLFAGRLSAEKGIFELPEIFRAVKQLIPGLKMVIAGSGPAEQGLKEAFPEATYLGWVEHEQLPAIYGSADLLILPSRFDTFSCVVLESLSCGLPVISYNTKGPKDIIQHSVNGFLAETPIEMSQRIIAYFSDPYLQDSFRKAAIRRAGDFTPDKILQKLMADIQLNSVKLPHEAISA